jgi:hypothetical protein
MLVSSVVSFVLALNFVVCSSIIDITSLSNDPTYYYLDEKNVTFNRQPKNIVIATSIGGSSVSLVLII